MAEPDTSTAIYSKVLKSELMRLCFARQSYGQLESESGVMCEILNDYFGSVFTSEDSMNELPEVRSNFNEDNDHMLSSIEITQDIIRNKLSKLKINKAPGVDGIVPRLLVENADILSEPLLYIYRKSIECGRVPCDWKKANVTAIFKKGDKTSPCNYRPVSLTSQVCKILESIVKDNVLDHIKKHKFSRKLNVALPKIGRV